MSLLPDLQLKKVPPRDPRDPSDPHYRRYWRYYNHPYAGCGFLWTTLLLLLIWLVTSMFFPQAAY
jgi:hypothetical protein